MKEYMESVISSVSAADVWIMTCILIAWLFRSGPRPKYQCPRCKTVNNRGYLDKILCRGDGCFFHDTPDKFIEIKFD